MKDSVRLCIFNQQPHSYGSAWFGALKSMASACASVNLKTLDHLFLPCWLTAHGSSASLLSNVRINSKFTSSRGRIGFLLFAVMVFISNQVAAQTAVSQSSRERAKYFCGKGEVVSLDKDARTATIKHEPIEGFMEEGMTMRFMAEDSDVLEDISAGDRVRFTLKDTPNKTRLVFIEKFDTKEKKDHLPQ